MNRLLQIVLAALFVTSVGMVVACGGGGSNVGKARPQPASKADVRAASTPNSKGKVEAVSQVEALESKDEAEFNRLVEARLRIHMEQFAEATSRYEVDLVSFSQAMKDYEKSIAEYPALSKAYDSEKLVHDSDAALESARKICDTFRVAIARAETAGKKDEAKRLTERLTSRYMEVVQSFPGTQADADARALIKGESPPRRPLTSLPSMPVKPVAPMKPIPPATPPSREDILATISKERADAAANEAAEKLRKKEATQAEAKRKAEDEYDARGLVLLRNTVEAKSNGIAFEITGTVENRRRNKLSYAQITFNVYDASGAQVGSALANINGLEPGGRWNFKAVAFEQNGRSYKFSELTGF